VQHYLERAAEGEPASFLDFVHSCSEHRVELVGSADTLAYAELNLTMRWLLRPSGRDARLLLRRALHGGGVAACDLALIDCPPLLNISCINALAAADFLLAPVMPSKASTERVQPMLSWLRTLRRTLNPDLKVLGVVANRTARGADMIDGERNLWSALRDQCCDTWGEEVYLCRTFIPQRAEIRDAENERRPLTERDDAFGYFKKLAVELAARLPQSCRPAAARART
jgi:cellulose biosynthesis protein BcsQ